ncbi:MAG: hypothetical protein JXM69_15230 [Anaerolineae bacterium]|nr:hypothetical protein [Anaerolineae bacterium]
MIAHAFRGPHNLYRRYQAFLESSVTALGLAALVSLTLWNMSVYPANWVLVMGVAMAVLGIRWPLLAYIMAVSAMIYPLYTINLYLAVIFVAVSVLGYRLFVHYLGATLLVLSTPLLAKYHLHWLVPILGGLWWGGIAGAWIGGLAALWGKIMGGMAGLNIDWLVMAGQLPNAQEILLRYHQANSLETLLLLIEPFASTSGVILYNLLQVIGWAVAGGFVGALAWRKWVKYRAPWSILVVTAGGGLIMMVTHLALPYWLHEAITDETVRALQDPAGPLFSLLMVIIVSTAIHSFRESLDLPVAPRRSSKTIIRKRKKEAAGAGANSLSRRSKAARGQGKKDRARPDNPVPLEEPDTLDRPRRPVRVPKQSELPEWEPPRDESGLIMLEID